MNINNTQASVFLFKCLDQDLRDDILRANPTTQVNDLPEADLITAIKTLAVQVKSKLVQNLDRLLPPKESHKKFKQSCRHYCSLEDKSNL